MNVLRASRLGGLPGQVAAGGCVHLSLKAETKSPLSTTRVLSPEGVYIHISLQAETKSPFQQHVQGTTRGDKTTPHHPRQR